MTFSRFSWRAEGRVRDLRFELRFVSFMPSVSYFGKMTVRESAWKAFDTLHVFQITIGSISGIFSDIQSSAFDEKIFLTGFDLIFVTTSSFPFRYFKWFKFIRKHISTFEKSFYLTFHWEKFSFHQNKVSRKWAVWHDSMYCNKNISLQQKSDTAIWISW